MLLAIRFDCYLWTVTGYAKTVIRAFEDGTEKKMQTATEHPDRRDYLGRGCGLHSSFEPTAIAQAIIRCAKQAWAQCLQLYEPESPQQQMQQPPERLS
jgi:hypothetical protein